jgi:hypothetical protein
MASNNMTPGDAYSVALGTANADKLNRPVPGGAPFQVGSNFSSPVGNTGTENALEGLTYSFDYKNARFVLLDQFMDLRLTLVSPGGTVYYATQIPFADTSTSLVRAWAMPDGTRRVVFKLLRSRATSTSPQ